MLLATLQSCITSLLGLVLRRDGAAVLLEVGAERLGTEEARALVAQAIAQGIRAYLEGGAP